MVTTTEIIEIKKAIDIFHNSRDIVELRIIEANGKIVSGYYDDFDKFCHDVSGKSGKAAGVNYVLN